MNQLKFLPFVFVLLLGLTAVQAVEFDQDISSADQAAFDKILEPVTKVYNLIKYGASVLAVLVILFAGISYITAGSDPKKRDNAKNMIGYVIVGLLVIWAAPLVVSFIV